MNEDKIQEIYNLIPEGYLSGTDELKEIISSEGLDGAYNLIPDGFYDNKSDFLNEFELSFTDGSMEQQEQPIEPLNQSGEPLVISKTEDELVADKLYEEAVKEYTQEEVISLKPLESKNKPPEKTIKSLLSKDGVDISTARKIAMAESNALKEKSLLIEQKNEDLSAFLEMVKKEESKLIEEYELDPSVVNTEFYKSKVASTQEMYDSYNTELKANQKEYLLFYNKNREISDYSKFLDKKQENIDQATNKATKDIKIATSGIGGYLAQEAVGSMLNFTESFIVASTSGFVAQAFDEGGSDDSFVTPEKIKSKLSELESLGYSESQIDSYKKAMSHKIKTQERNKDIKSNLVKFGMDRVESANIRTKDWALTNSISKIDSSNPLDYIAFAINASAEIAPQLVLTKATGGLGTFVTTSGSMYIDAVSRQVDAEMERSGSTREEAFDVVMSDTKINKVGLNTGALIVSALDYVGSLKILGGAGKEVQKKLVKEMLDDVVLSRTGKILKTGKEFVEGQIVELGTELVQEGIESEATSMSIGNQFGEGLKEFTVDETLDLVTKVAVGTIGPQIIQAVSSNNFSNNLIKSIANDFEAKTFAFEQIDSRILKGEITQIQADQIKGRIDKKMAHVKSLSEMISDDNIEEAMQLQDEWDSFEEQISTNTTGLKSLLKSKQKEVQTKLEELANSKPVDAEPNVESLGAEAAPSKTNEVEKLRQQEQDEMLEQIPNSEDFLTDGKVDRDKIDSEEGKAKFDEIYDRYDKLITPLLEDTSLEIDIPEKFNNITERVSKGELINNVEISDAIEEGYSLLEQLDGNNSEEATVEKSIIEEEIAKLENYENITETKNVKTTERRSIKTPIESPTKAIDSDKFFEGEEVEINGFPTTLSINNGRLEANASDGVVVIDRPSLDVKEDGISFDESGRLESITLVDRFGSEVLFKGEAALDLAIKNRENKIGTVPEAMFETAYQEIVSEKTEEVSVNRVENQDLAINKMEVEEKPTIKDAKSKAFDSIDSIAEKLKKALSVDIPGGRKTQGVGVTQNDIIDLASRAVKALVATRIDVKVAIDKVISELKSQGIFNVFNEKSITDALSNKENKPKAKSVYSETRGMSEREYFTQGFEEVYSSLRNKISEIKNKYKEEIKNLKEDSKEKKLAERELIAKLSLSIEAILPKDGVVSRSIAIQLSKANTVSRVEAVIDRLEKLATKNYEKQLKSIKDKASDDILNNLLKQKNWTGEREKGKPRKKKLTDETISLLKEIASVYNEAELESMSADEVVSLQKEIIELLSESELEIKSINSAKKKVRKVFSGRITEMIARKNNKKKPLNNREDAVDLLKSGSVVIIDGVTFNSLKDFKLAYPEGTKISGESIYIPSQPGLSMSGIKSRLWSRFSKILDLQGMLETFIQTAEDKSFISEQMLKPSSDKFYGKDNDIQKLDKARRKLVSETLNKGKGLVGAISKVARLYEKSGISFINKFGEKSLETTNDNAIYLYNAFKQLDGVEKFIGSGYSLKEVSAVIDYINSNQDLKAYADGLNSIYSEYLPSINESLVSNGFESIAEATTKSKEDLAKKNGEEFANDYYEILSKIYGGEQNIPAIERYSPISVSSKQIDSMQNTNIFDSKAFNISAFAPNVFERSKGGTLNIRSSTSVFNSYSDSMANMVHSLDLLKKFQSFMTTENRRLIVDNYGQQFYQSIENSMNDIIYGKAKSTMSDAESYSSMKQWLNNANASVMFLNFKSAATQLLSVTNFALESDISFSDYMNNAFNYSSKEMVTAREELSEALAIEYRGDRNASSIEIDALKNSEFGDKDVTQNASHLISSVLSKGYYFTSKADVFAIKLGGAPYYMAKRNEFYAENIASGMEKTEAYKDAKDRALKKTYEVANKTQQSSNLDRVSAEQKDPLSRLVLTFGTVSMQYNREMISAARDIRNGRGDLSNNLAKIVYYGTIQNVIFQTISAAMGAIGGEDDEVKGATIINRSIDSLLKGFGVYGVAASAAKNGLYDFYSYVKRKQNENGELSNADKKAIEELTDIDFNKKTYKEPQKVVLNTISSISPAIGGKTKQAVGLFYQAGDGEYTKAVLNSINFAANVPADRLLDLTDAFNEDLSGFHRLARITNIMKNYEVEKNLQKKEKSKTSGRKTSGRETSGREVSSGRDASGREVSSGRNTQ